MKIKDCLWVQSPNLGGHVFRPILQALKKRDAKVWSLNDCSAESLSRLRERVWKSDEHVILQGLLGRELHALQPIFEQRKNFSVVLIDWWNSPFWFTRNATYQIFHNYNGIAVRTGRDSFLGPDRPPLFALPQNAIRYHVIGSLLRPAAMVVAPALNIPKRRQRAGDAVHAARLLYFPFPIDAADVPLRTETLRYDFTSMGSTMGLWIMRDPYVSASLNFANLYADRRRLGDLIWRFNGQPFAVHDRWRGKYNFLPWDEVCRVVQQSRFAVCTGGLHKASIPKFLEYVCLGTPVIGSGLPFEYPWLDQCLFHVDTMNVTATELKPKLEETLSLHSRLRENCLAVRDSLLALYNAERLLQLLQDQIDGQPMPPGYLKV